MEARNCDLERRWDKLHYVLSAHRRGEPGTATDALLDVAVRGESLIAKHVRSGQGVPVRHTPPERVAEIARVLAPMTWASLERHCVPEWTWLRESFDRFRAFYLAAAEHGDAVLVCTD